MDIRYNPNAVNQFIKGTDVFKEGELVFYIGMIVKGRVVMHHEGARIILGSGAFLGINDLYTGRYQSTYTAYDDLLIYLYPVKGVEELEVILSSNKDYHGFMVASFYKVIYESDQIYQNIIKNTSELYQFIKDTVVVYQNLADRKGIKVSIPEQFTNLSLLDYDLDLVNDRVRYYSECRNLPIDVVKAFYSYGNAVTLYQLEDQVSVVNLQFENLKELARQYLKMAKCLVDDSEANLFKLIAELALKSGGSSDYNNQIMDVMDSIIEEINKAETFAERMLGSKLEVDRNRMEEVYHLLLTSGSGKDENAEVYLKYSKQDATEAMKEMEDAFAKILTYAEIDGEKAEQMQEVMLKFLHLKDKSSSEDGPRTIRRRLTENHYEIYKKVFFKAIKDKNVPRLIDLFLKYGFADERLLTKEQMLSLYFLNDQLKQDGACKVYDIKTWLTLIYEGEKQPSKNEFDQEYPDMVASLRKQGRLSEKEAKEWLNDPVKKVEYEIDNMFRYNNRTTNGQITSFAPVLHKDLMGSDLDRLLVTEDKVNDAVNSIMQIDYSLFDRETIYSNNEKNIVKEYVIKRVFPDVILLPNVGANGVMWQEISGKRRDSAGRFLLPIFTDINLGLILIKVCGRYRWELCRTIEGTAWNDITHRSLTSEYSDYLQFYRKNKDLSDEKKEKIKQQIQKGRNNNREIFVIDYEQWIQYESRGAIKLNKPVREILATYCPFSKQIREKVRLQPLFEEAMVRYNKEKQKKIKEIEGRYRLLQKEQVELPQELIDTLNYYKEL